MSLRTSQVMPWYWKMPHHDGNEAKLFDLAPTDQLYRRVQRMFHKQQSNCTHPYLPSHSSPASLTPMLVAVEFEILSIKFIQCPRRWHAYVANRQHYIDFGGRTDIKYERCLWHGTAYENIHKIAKQGSHLFWCASFLLVVLLTPSQQVFSGSLDHDRCTVMGSTLQ